MGLNSFRKMELKETPWKMEFYVIYYIFLSKLWWFNAQIINIQSYTSKLLNSDISQYCWIGNHYFMANEEN